jgi:aminotransferase
MADLPGIVEDDDVAFAMRLVREAKVAVVPGSSFFSRPELGRRLVRFCFCKRDETLDEAVRRLDRWSGAP